jgi:hypothetical protein
VIESYSMSGYYLSFDLDNENTGAYLISEDTTYGKSIEWTPLQMAAAYGRYSIYLLLLSKGGFEKIKFKTSS